MEGVQVPASRAEGQRGTRAEGAGQGPTPHVSMEEVLVWARTLEKVEQPGNKRDWKKRGKKKNQKRTVKYTEPETGR